MVKVKSFRGKVAVVTGGSSGIGLATARELASLGSEVYLLARDEKRLKSVARKLPGKVNTFPCDVREAPSIFSARDHIIERSGHLDILVNSAGIIHSQRFGSLSNDQIKEVIDVDLLGTIETCRSFLDDIHPHGYIVNISSVAGFLGLTGYAPYSAAKFGIVGFSEALRMELHPKGIGVGVVFPPDTETPQLESERRTRPSELSGISSTLEPIRPEKVASAIISGMRKGRFLIFPTWSARLLYITNNAFGPIVRSWLDRKAASYALRSGKKGRVRG